MSQERSITEFRNQYFFLSNFFPCWIMYAGWEYASVEHAYHAAKTQDLSEREAIYLATSPANAKALGRAVHLRPDWLRVRVSIMETLLRRKFAAPELRRALLATGTAELIEGNDWGDTFWGVWNGVGENHLGKLLMKIRAEL